MTMYLSFKLLLVPDFLNLFFLSFTGPRIELLVARPSFLGHSKDPWIFWDCPNDSQTPNNNKNFEGFFVCIGFNLQP